MKGPRYGLHISSLLGPLGAPSLGGSIATAGCLVFTGATTDKFLHAFDAAKSGAISTAASVHEREGFEL